MLDLVGTRWNDRNVPAAAPAGGIPTRLGKYELLMPLAAGGMARIYIGRSTGIGSFERHVVLKLITPERANDQTAVQMFLDEARLAASLNHQNVAQVFEVGEDLGIHYLAMEYVHGQDLRALLAKAGSQGTRVPLELALTIVAGAASGLNHAHERRAPDGTPLGIVHRDVSPSNLMIGYDGAVKLLDFGIAKATQRSVETQSGIIKGKFAYMAPEQCRGRDVDKRSDVFSLGIILYEVTTQHRCFRADSDFDTMHRIVTGDVVRPTRLVQGYPQALEAIVMKALAIDASQRYQSATFLLEAIESFAVASRMSLSTMALGRFMRDMFGEHPEPWLVTGRMNAVMPPKENTISSTDGRGSGAQRAIRGPMQTEPPPIARPDEANLHVQPTLLDLPRGLNDTDREDPNAADWNAKSYPTMRPAGLAPPAAMPSDSGINRRSYPPAGAAADTIPTQVPAGTQPLSLPISTPQGAFASAPSGSGVAIPSTKHGYAGAPGQTRGDSMFPQVGSAAGLGGDLPTLRPNRRPLFIGIGVVLVGAVALIAVKLTGGGSDASSTFAADAASVVGATPDNSVGSDHTTPPVATANDGVDDYVALHVISHPPGADVLIAGKKIGVTPLDTKIKRSAAIKEAGTTMASLVIKLDGYVDVASKIDLTGDYAKDIPLKKAAAPVQPVPTPTTPVPTPPPVDHSQDHVADHVPDHTPDHPVEHTPDHVATDPHKAPPPHNNTPRHEHPNAVVNQPKQPEQPKQPKQPTCQPPGGQDPFDPRPVCKT